MTEEAKDENLKQFHTKDLEIHEEQDSTADRDKDEPESQQKIERSKSFSNETKVIVSPVSDYLTSICVNDQNLLNR